MVHKSDGQVLVEKLEAWLSGYLTFPKPYYALVAALWALNTRVFPVFDATPYLAITAETKRAGKTTLLDLLGFLSLNTEKGGAGTAASLYRLMEEHGGMCSLFFDEAERMASGAVGMMRTFMNFGYRRGETIPRTMPGGRVEKFPCYCPKAFALIGDLSDTLRDRSILFVMRRAAGGRPYRPTTANNEAVGLVSEIKGYLASGALESLPIVAPEWLEARDQEIWESLWSLALAMKLDKATLLRLQAASTDLVALKGAPVKKYDKTQQAEDALEAESMGEKAIKDLRTIIREGETAVWSATAVERMREIPTSPWREYKGVGLDEVTLAALVSRFGVHTRSIKRSNRVARGYQVKDLKASSKG